MTEPITIMAVGDLVLQEPDADFYFGPSTDVLHSADLAIGQIEVPHSVSEEVTGIVVPSPPAEPEALGALARAGFTVGTVAGNHAFDVGTQGVLDTIRHSADHGIATTGTGANLAEAETPVLVERGGHRIGVLSFNAVGPRESWATTKKAGSAFVKIITHYELDDANPGNPPTIYTFCEPTSAASMAATISDVAARVDVLVVALHKGIGHTPAVVAPYEIELAHRAIDAGASVVVGHHSHILRGIEMYKDRAIFHGLGNFVTVTDVLTPGPGNDSVELERWARRRRELYGFTPDPAMPTYPFHPESRNTMIATIDVDESGSVTPGFVPCWIDDEARPVPHGDDETGRSVADYIERISITAGFATRFEWTGERVTVSAREHAEVAR